MLANVPRSDKVLALVAVAAVVVGTLLTVLTQSSG